MRGYLFDFFEKYQIRTHLITVLFPFLYYIVLKYFPELTPFNKIKNPLPFIFFCLFIQLLYFYTYLFEKIRDMNEKNKSEIWFLFRYSFVLLYITLVFAISYFFVFEYDPNSISKTDILEGNTFQRLFEFFYYSLGNFLGYGSSFDASSLSFKILRILQALVGFTLLVVILSNITNIRMSFNKKR